jgi:methylmalonyl-CoA/ethylmalonyl-CoA epimerase
VATVEATVNDDTFGLHTIGQLRIPVTDAERAATYYRDVLGMRFLFAYPGMAFFDCDGVRLLLAAREDAPDAAGSGGHDTPVTLYFTVRSVDEAYERLTGRGALAVSTPQVVHRTETYELWMAFVRDPDGNQIGVMAEVPLRG